MSGIKEKWQELCERVIAERDPQRLSELLKSLNQELEKRESRRKGVALHPQSPSNEDEGALACGASE